MSAIARIKKTAAQHEQERQYDKALALYARLLDGAEAGEEELDVGLFNRAGDLALRLGDAPRAVGYFERALDLYAAGGLLNNAVALGVKILRHAPNHLSAHYTLGVLYGRKGFVGDARHHLLTYAVQMQRGGRADEAGRVLAEVAATCATCGDPADLRAALDAYGALGGDPAQAAALAPAETGGAPRPVPADPAASPVAGATLLEVALDQAPTWDGMLSVPAAVDRPAAELLPHAAADPAALGWEPLAMNLAEITPVLPAAPAADPVVWSALDLAAVEPTFEAPDPWSPTPAFDPTNEGSTTDGASLVFLDTSKPVGAAAEPRPGGMDRVRAAVPTRDGVMTGEGALAPPQAATAALRWADALPGDPPPLRLGELAHVVPVAPSQAPRPHTTDDCAPAMSAPPAAAGHCADLLAVELASLVPGGVPAPARYTPPAAPAADEEPLDLGAWLRDTTPVASTRLTTPVVPQSGDEQADFDATLRAFTSGVARAVEPEDFDSHYDLGVAFREMGLLDEAIVEFQRAVRAPGRPLRALEALAQCFLDAGQPELALTTLHEPAVAAAASGVGDASLVAVHYLMGAAADAVGRRDDARRWLVRVVATDVRFRDAASRLAALPPPTPVR